MILAAGLVWLVLDHFPAIFAHLDLYMPESDKSFFLHLVFNLVGTAFLCWKLSSFSYRFENLRVVRTWPFVDVSIIARCSAAPTAAIFSGVLDKLLISGKTVSAAGSAITSWQEATSRYRLSAQVWNARRLVFILEGCLLLWCYHW